MLVLGLAGCAASAPPPEPQPAPHPEPPRPFLLAMPSMLTVHAALAPEQPGQTSTPTVVVAQSLAGDQPTAPGIVELRQSATGLSPQFTVVPVGTTLRFCNDDDICHRYFSTSPAAAFDLQPLQPGTAAECALAQPGPVQVYCALHKSRQATVVVVPTAHFAILDAAGNGTIPDLEPGRYRIELWTDGVPRRHTTVDIGPGEPNEVVLPADDDGSRGRR